MNPRQAALRAREAEMVDEVGGQSQMGRLTEPAPRYPPIEHKMEILSTLEDQTRQSLIEIRRDIEESARALPYHRSARGGWFQHELDAALAPMMDAGFFPKDLLSIKATNLASRPFAKRKAEETPEERLKRLEGQEKSGANGKEDEDKEGAEAEEVVDEADDALDWNNHEATEYFDDDEDMDDGDDGGDDEGGTF